MSGEKKGAVHIAEDVIISIASAAVNEVRGVEKIRSDYGFFQKKNPVRVRATGDVLARVGAVGELVVVCSRHVERQAVGGLDVELLVHEVGAETYEQRCYRGILVALGVEGHAVVLVAVKAE